MEQRETRMYDTVTCEDGSQIKKSNDKMIHSSENGCFKDNMTSSKMKHEQFDSNGQQNITYDNLILEEADVCDYISE